MVDSHKRAPPEQQSLKTLLSQFYTEEGKAAFIAGIVGKRAVAREYVERTIDFYERKKDYIAGKSLAIKAGLQQKVDDLEQRIRDMRTISDIPYPSLVITQEEREQAVTLIRKYNENKEYDASVELGVKVIDAYHLLGYSDHAVAVALEHGLYQKAIEIREQEQKWNDAGALAEAQGLYERAGINYEHAKNYGKAGDCFVAEVEARKEQRKKSKNVLVSTVFSFITILTTEEKKLLLRALENYSEVDWEQSAQNVIGMLDDKEAVYKFHERRGEFQKAEAYAIRRRDQTRTQFYKTIDVLVNLEREVAEKAIEHERQKKQEAKNKIQEIRKDLEKNYHPSVVGIDEKDLASNTSWIGYKCSNVVDIVLEKYGCGYVSKKDLPETLEQKFVKTNMLHPGYVTTLRTMQTLEQVIDQNKIKTMDPKSYAKYYREAKDFIDAMEQLVDGKKCTQKSLCQNRLDSGNNSKNVVQYCHQKTLDVFRWLCAEIGTTGIAEIGFYVIKKEVLVPALGAIGIIGGGIHYFDSWLWITQKEEAPVAAQHLYCPQKKESTEGRFCRTYRWDATLTSAEQKYDIPEGLLAGFVMQQSKGDPTEIYDNYTGLFLFDPTIAKEEGLLVYSSEKKALKKLKEDTEQKTEEMAKYDHRFDIEKATETAGAKIQELYRNVREKQMNNEYWKQHDSWDLAISAFYNGIDRADDFVKSSNVKAVRDYQEYYLSHT